MFSRLIVATLLVSAVSAQAEAQQNAPSTLIVVDAPQEMKNLGASLVQATQYQRWLANLATDAKLAKSLDKCQSDPNPGSRQRCLAQLVGKQSADTVLFVRVRIEADTGSPDKVLVVANATLFDKQGAAKAAPELACRDCDNLDQSSVVKVVEVAVRLIRQHALVLAPNTRLTVEIDPPDGQVLIQEDGTTLGAGTHPIPPGAMNVHASHLGYEGATQEKVVVEPNTTVTVTFQLNKLPGDPTDGDTTNGGGNEHKKPPFLKAHGPKLLTVVGGAALISGIALIALDEDNGVRDGVRHATYFDSAPAGYGLAAVGAVVGAVGLILWLSPDKKADDGVTIAPTRRGAAIFWRSSF